MPDTPFDEAPVMSSPVTDKLDTLEIPMQRRLSTSPVGQARAVSFGSARPFAFIKRKRTTHRQLRLNDEELQEPLNPAVQGGEPGVQNSKLYKQVFSVPFFELTLTFAITSCFANVFLGNMQAEAKSSLLIGTPSYTETEVTSLAASSVALYFRLAPLSGMFNPLLGMCVDRFGLGPMLMIMLSCGVFHSLSLWLGAFYVGAAFFSVYCTGYFAYMYSALAFEFGFEYYGLLAGIVQSFGSVATLTLQPRIAAAAAVYGWPSIQFAQVLALAGLGLVLVISKLIRRKPQVVAPVTTSPKSQKSQNGKEASSAGGSRPTSPTNGMNRAYSAGDVHEQLVDTPCRRRKELFPAADDILLIDGADTRHSVEAYQVEKPLRKESL